MEIIIPEGSIEIQTGLFAYLNSFTVNGVQYSFYDLYSAEGYCFWDVSQPENYYEDGTLKPPIERVYARVTYTCYTTIEELNETFVSVQIEEGFELVNNADKSETE